MIIASGPLANYWFEEPFLSFFAVHGENPSRKILKIKSDIQRDIALMQNVLID